MGTLKLFSRLHPSVSNHDAKEISIVMFGLFWSHWTTISTRPSQSESWELDTILEPKKGYNCWYNNDNLNIFKYYVNIAIDISGQGLSYLNFDIAFCRLYRSISGDPQSTDYNLLQLDSLVAFQSDIGRPLVGQIA